MPRARSLLRNWPLKLAALALSFLLWALVRNAGALPAPPAAVLPCPPAQQGALR